MYINTQQLRRLPYFDKTKKTGPRKKAEVSAFENKHNPLLQFCAEGMIVDTSKRPYFLLYIINIIHSRTKLTRQLRRVPCSMGRATIQFRLLDEREGMKV